MQNLSGKDLYCPSKACMYEGDVKQMIKRRMIALDVIKSNRYQSMPVSTKCLYTELLVRADDAGIIDDSYSIMRMTGASNDDLKLLVAKGYVIAVDDELYVIADWAVHNDTTKRWFKRGKCTLYKDIFDKLNWQPDCRYEYMPDMVLLPNDDQKNQLTLMSDITTATTEVKAETAADTENTNKKTADVVMQEMDQIIALLSRYGISRQSPKGRQIAESYSLDKVEKGIQYAKENMPDDCKNISGWFIKCIELEQHNSKLTKCPKCHGSGKQQTIGPDPDKTDGSILCYVSDCVMCTGTGFVK